MRLKSEVTLRIVAFPCKGRRFCPSGPECRIPIPPVAQTALVALGIILARLGSAGPQAAVFVDDTFEDFSRGTLDAGGQNLYVSRDGKVRTIHRFDLNDDGYLDVIFNCTHDTHQLLSATIGRVASDRVAASAPLAVEGSQQVALADLDRDGYTDAVICSNSLGVDSDRRLIKIAWGGADGWAAHRVSGVLPLDGAIEVAVADLNRDGWSDIVGLSAPASQEDPPDGRLLRVFWGSPGGFSAAEFQNLREPNAIALSAGDFDGDGARDLAILRRDGHLVVLWADPVTASGGRFLRVVVALPAPTGVCLTAADTDGDGRVDLAVGTSGPELFLLRSRTDRVWQPAAQIRAFPATNVAVGDLDRDGHSDLVLTHFSQEHAAGASRRVPIRMAQTRFGSYGDPTFDTGKATVVRSPRCRRCGCRRHGRGWKPGSPRRRAPGQNNVCREPPSYSTETDAGPSLPAQVAFPPPGQPTWRSLRAEKSLPARAFFCNSIGGMLQEAIPVLVYWGSKTGLDPKRVWKIPFHSGYEASAADLNADGHVGSGGASTRAMPGNRHSPTPPWGPTFSGGATRASTWRGGGPFSANNFLAPAGSPTWTETDIWTWYWSRSRPEKPGETDQISIYYGSPDGFTTARRVKLPSVGYAQEHLIADFNADHWLDIGVATRGLNCIRIFWGGPTGFDPGREQRLKVAAPVGVDAADFNGDGHLDIFTGAYSDPGSGHRDMGVTIFWGSPAGYRAQNAQWLPGFASLGRTVADFDADGYLDLFSPQQSGELIREDLACHIYWGGPGGFSMLRRTTLFCDSVNDSFAGDFNDDGKIDLAVACHTRHGDHRANSLVFYNDGQRFENPRIQKLPTAGPHLIWAQDMGHILTRKNEQSFTSAVFRWDRPTEAGHLTTRAEIPHGTQLAFFIRSAATPAALAGKGWQPVIGADSLWIRRTAISNTAPSSPPTMVTGTRCWTGPKSY